MTWKRSKAIYEGIVHALYKGRRRVNGDIVHGGRVRAVLGQKRPQPRPEIFARLYIKRPALA